MMTVFDATASVLVGRVEHMDWLPPIRQPLTARPPPLAACISGMETGAVIMI